MAEEPKAACHPESDAAEEERIFHVPDAKAEPTWIIAGLGLVVIIADVAWGLYQRSSLTGIMLLALVVAVPVALSFVSNFLLMRTYNRFKVTAKAFVALRKWGADIEIPWEQVREVVKERTLGSRWGAPRIRITSAAGVRILIPRIVLGLKELVDSIKARVGEDACVAVDGYETIERHY